MPARRGLRRVHHQHVRHAGDERDRHEVLDRVVRHLRIERRVDRLRADRSHQQRVAVGRRLGDEVGAEVAAGAGLVLDDEGLAEGLAELGRERARQDVGRAAGANGTTMRTGLVGQAPWARAQARRGGGRDRGPRANDDEATWRGACARMRAPRRQCGDARATAERGLARGGRRGGEQRRRSGTTGRGSLSKSPDCPLLLDVRRPAEVDPSRPVPGASEWGSLARVRRDVRKPFLAATSRRTEQGQLLRHVRRPRQHRRALRERGERRGRRQGETPPRLNQRARSTKAEVSMAVDLDADQDAERRGARRAQRQADDVLDAGAGRIGELAPAARARRGDACGRRRSRGAAATTRRRGSAARRGGAAERQSGDERRETTSSRLSSDRARGQHLVAGLARDMRRAQRLCQAGSRDRRHASPGARRPARRRGALTRRAAAATEPRRTRKQVLRGARHRDVLMRGKAQECRNAAPLRRSHPRSREEQDDVR